MCGTREGDVYSFGLIMKELIKRELPFIDQPNDQRLEQLVADIASGILKAEEYVRCSGNGIPEHVFEIMRQCVSFVPSRRMGFAEIQNMVHKMDKSLSSKSGKSNIVDNMVLKLEKYTNKLEDIVAEKTHQLELEMKKSDELLNRMLPGWVSLVTAISIDLYDSNSCLSFQLGGAEPTQWNQSATGKI